MIYAALASPTHYANSRTGWGGVGFCYQITCTNGRATSVANARPNVSSYTTYFLIILVKLALAY